MLGIKKRDTKQVFKAIAHQQGVSVSEVKERIQSTIDEMYYSDDPVVQAEFSSYFGNSIKFSSVIDGLLLYYTPKMRLCVYKFYVNGILFGL